MFKYAVDALTADPSGAVLAATPLMHMVPAAALLGYGAARATSSLCNELRNAVFAKVRLIHNHTPWQGRPLFASWCMGGCPAWLSSPVTWSVRQAAWAPFCLPFFPWSTGQTKLSRASGTRDVAP